MSTSFYDEIHQVPNLFARAIYSTMADIDRYTPGEAHTTRISAIVSSSISIFAGIIGIYFFLAIDYKKRVFRHQLIFFLIVYDCIKALFLLLYPARVVAKVSVYYDLKFCKVVGFFTALSIEGSDIAILSFAIHIALLVFKPNQTIKRGMSYEGGLFRYRYYVYAISILLPILLASLAFINGVGYAPLTNWCYMPTSPLWYRLVLSWIPRYLIIITIFVIYGCVYHHVTKQYSNVRNTIIRPDESEDENTSTWKKFYKALGFVLFLNVFTSDSLKKDGKNDTPINEEQQTNFENGSSYDTQSREERINNNHNLIPGNLNEDALQQFRRRQKQVERQMKTIFIYPVSYVFLWTFPLIVQAVNFKYTNSNNKPIVWLSSLSAFMKAFNCTVDTVVFLIREKPWKIITSKVDTSPTEKYTYSRWRHFISFLPLFSLPKSHEDSPDYALNNSFSDPIFHDYSKVLSDTGHVDGQLIQLTSNKLNVNNNNASILPNKHLRNETNSEHNNSDEEIPHEMDFTEFLKMGPPR